MAVMSKYIDWSSRNFEKTGLPKSAISQAIIGAAVFAYTIKLTSSLLRKTENNDSTKKLTNAKSNSNNHQLLQTNVDETWLGQTVADSTDEEARLAEAEKLLVKQQLKHKKNQLEPGINKEFIKQLRKLLQIMIPKPFCYETGLLCVHTLCLISRTFLSIYVAALEGAIVKFIVRKDVKQFSIVLLKWFGIAVPATFINSMIRFLESKLSLAFRTRLVRHSYRLYFKNQNYYRVSNLDGRIENADHSLVLCSFNLLLPMPLADVLSIKRHKH